MSSSSKEMSKFEKEKQKLVQEKCQGLLNEMLRDDDNKYCVDCDAKGPRWASWNLGIFLCIRCAGIHRNLGVHISRVKSVNLDSWTPEQVVTMQQMGNSRARAVYEANLPDNFRRPQTDVALENFIRAKYEHTKYIAQEWVKPAPPRVDWNSEIEEQIRKKKEKNRAEPTVGVLPKFGSKINTSPSISNKISQQPKKIAAKVEVSLPNNVTAAAAPPPVQPTSASDDLLGLTTGNEFVDPFASPVKSTNGGGGVTAVTTTEDDLGSVFTSSGGGAGDGGSGKMSKESILSLYGSLSGGGGGGTGQSAFAGGGVPGGVLGGATNNPFVGGGGQGFGAGGPGSTTNPFPQQTGWGAGGGGDLVGNGFGGLVGGLGGIGQQQTAQQQQSNLSQLQQGIFSLNLSTGPAPPHQNSNVLFNTNVPTPTPPQSNNLNMLMMNSTAPQQPGGFFSGLTNTSISSPPQQMIPPAQQFNLLQQQQNVAFNQFQSATSVPTPSPANSSVGFGVNGGSAAGAGNHVDLLWK